MPRDPSEHDRPARAFLSPVFRRPRRLVAAGAWRKARPRRVRRRRAEEVVGSISIGAATLRLTPRQAVVWLMNLEGLLKLHQSMTGLPVTESDRQRADVALRAIIMDRGTSAPNALRSPRLQ